jgi:hypothetical protein
MVAWRFEDIEMTKDPLSDRLEYAILKAIASRKATGLSGQDGELTELIARWQVVWIKDGGVLDTEYTDADLLAAFKRLWRNGIVTLTKYDTASQQRVVYSGHEADDRWFFYNEYFSVGITDEGRSHWNQIEQVKSTSRIGFTP